MKTSDITFTISLDDENLPEDIRWQAAGSGVEGAQQARSVMISLWDSPEKGSMRIDLWTKSMMVEEMQRFFYETLSSMADTYRRATGDQEQADAMRAFAKSFGVATKILKT